MVWGPSVLNEKNCDFYILVDYFEVAGKHFASRICIERYLALLSRCWAISVKMISVSSLLLSRFGVLTSLFTLEDTVEINLK